MNEKKHVKVLLSTYNGEKYLEEQIRSILSQKEVEVSILVRDDGSNDRTIDILKQFAREDDRIQWYKGFNIGCARSFLDLIQSCPINVEYFALCDQDDYWLPEKLKNAVSILEIYDKELPNLYYSKTKRVGRNLEEIDNPYKKDYHVESFPGVIFAPSATGCTMVLNRKLVNLLRNYCPDYLWMHDAWVLGVCGALGGNIYYDNESHILYRQHNNNVVGNIYKMEMTKGQLLKSRIKKFFDFEYKPSQVAKEIVNGYKGVISIENKEVLELLSESGKKARKRKLLLLRKENRIEYRIIKWKLVVQIIMEKD